MKKILTLLLILSLALLPLSGCDWSEIITTIGAPETVPPNVAREPKNGSQYRIGFTYYYASEFMNLLLGGIEAKADELGMKVVELDAENDPANQLNQVENLIAQQVDCLMIAAVDAQGIVPALSMAREAGIPLVVVNLAFSTDEPYYFYGPDDVDGGYLEAQYAYEAARELFPDVKRLNGIIIQGPVGTSAMMERQEGNDLFLDEIGREENLNIFDMQPKNWSREEACTYVENCIQAYGIGGTDGMHLIISHNDEMALGAIQAIESQGYVPGKDIIVTGIDAIEDACHAVLDGKQYATLYQDAGREGGGGVQLCYDILTGNPPETPKQYMELTCFRQDNVSLLLDTIYYH